MGFSNIWRRFLRDRSFCKTKEGRTSLSTSSDADRNHSESSHEMESFPLPSFSTAVTSRSISSRFRSSSMPFFPFISSSFLSSQTTNSNQISSISPPPQEVDSSFSIISASSSSSSSSSPKRRSEKYRLLLELKSISLLSDDVSRNIAFESDLADYGLDLERFEAAVGVAEVEQSLRRQLADDDADAFHAFI